MKLEQLLEAFQPNLFQELCNDFGFFISLNTVSITQYATDSAAKAELQQMQKTFRAPAVNGKIFADVLGDRVLMNDPKGRAAILKYVHSMLQYTEPRLQRFLNDEGKNQFLPRLEKIKQKYIELVNKQ